jgi:universal stress protein E
MISAHSKQIADSIRQAQEEMLEDLTTLVAQYGLSVATAIIHHRPASDAIVAKALESEPAFVVKGTVYHSPAERATFTFTDWQLMRKLSYPLWLVKPQEWKENPVIIAAIDPMHQYDKEGVLDQAIIDAAKTLESRCDGKVLLLHTYQRLDEIGTYAKLRFKPTKVPLEEIEAKMRDEHRRHLDLLAAKNGILPEAVHQLPGRTREVLPTFARANAADLVIMGALARSGLKRRIIGSTAEQVMDHLPCDVLIARKE